MDNFLSKFASTHSDYSQLPTEELIPQEEPCASDGERPNLHTIDVKDSADLQDAPMKMANTVSLRHTVAIGAIELIESPGSSQRQSESQGVPLTQEHQAAAEHGEEGLAVSQASCFRFVEKSWFQAISAVIIISNVITTVMEMDNPLYKNVFFISDQVMLTFYVVELYSRASYFGFLFLSGPSKFVCWNVLDIIVVVAGVLDQWLMPVLPVGKDNGLISKVLQLLRLLRLLRVFKIVRVFLDIDLSWTEQPAFQSFIGGVIMVNSLLMGLEIDVPWWGWFYIEQFLLCIYVFELSVRLKNFGKYFFSCHNMDIVWNILDFIIVVSSVLDTWLTPLAGVIVKSLSGTEGSSHQNAGLSLGKVMMLMRMLRLMRILRLAKLVKSVRPLFVLVTGVAAACQGVAWVLVLTVVILYAMGILATSLIGKKMAFPPGAEVPSEVLVPFETVPDSMFTLFRVMSGAASDWEQAAIDKLMESIPTIKFGFVFFMISSSWTLLSILTAVVSENMISTTGQQEEEHKLANAEEDRIDHVAKLKEVFEIIDNTGDGVVECNEIENFLSDKANAAAAAKRCRVPVRDVREVLQTVTESCDGTTVSLDAFVEHLADVSKVVTEKSAMKLEAKLINIGKQQVKTEALCKSQAKEFEKLVNTYVQKTEAAFVNESRQQHKAEVACQSELKEIERRLQGFAEKTEASLSAIQQKNQGLVESVTEALEQVLPKFGFDRLMDMMELQFRRMKHDLLCNMKGPESDSASEKSTPAQELSSTEKPVIVDGAAGLSDTMESDSEEQLGPLTKNQKHDADLGSTPSVQMDQSTAQIEARLLATEKSIHGWQQQAESMFKRNERFLERMSKSMDQGLSAPAPDRFSETLLSELRMIRQELLFCQRHQSLETSKVRDTGDKQLVPIVEIQADLDGIPPTEVLTAQLEARLLTTEKSIHGLQQNTEASLRKIKGLLETAVGQGAPALAIDRFSETLMHELHGMRQELLSNISRQQLQVSRARDGLQKATGPADIDAASTKSHPDSS